MIEKTLNNDTEGLEYASKLLTESLSFAMVSTDTGNDINMLAGIRDNDDRLLLSVGMITLLYRIHPEANTQAKRHDCLHRLIGIADQQAQDIKQSVIH